MGREQLRAWALLVVTVVLEVIGTLSLRASEGFSVLLPSLVSVVAYVGAVAVLSLALTVIPMSIAYVIWTGAGTTGVAVLGIVLFDDQMTPMSWAGIVLVVAGVIMINAGRTTPTREHDGAGQEHAE